MISSPKGWRERTLAFWSELERRKVLHTLAIYGAVGWAMLASAPDLIQYLGLPDWSFSALVTVLVLGLPATLVISWHVDVLLSTDSGAAEPEGGARDEEDGSVPQGETEATGERRTVRGAKLALSLAVVIFAAVGISVLFNPDRTDGPVRVFISPGSSSAGSTPDEGDIPLLIQQPLGWLVEVRVLTGSAEPVGSLSQGLEQAEELGARYLIITETGRTGGSLSVAATLYSVPTGERLSQWVDGGPEGDPEGAATRIAVQVAKFIAPLEGLALRVRPDILDATSSPMALAHYLEAHQRFADTDYDGAVDALHRAVEADSDFLPAYYRLAVVERWRWNHEAGLQAIDLALSRPAIPPRWDRLLRAQRAYLLRHVDETIQRYGDVTLHYPELLDGWLGLGEALFHFGGFAGHAPVDARQALERAISGDSTISPITHHLAELALFRGDSAEARRMTEWMSPHHPVRPVMELALDLRGSDETRSAALARLPDQDWRTLSMLVAHFAFDVPDRDMIRTLSDVLSSPQRAPGDRLRGAQYRLVAAGSAEAVQDALRRWREVGGGPDFDAWAVHLDQAGVEVPEVPRMLAWADQQRQAGIIPDFELPLNAELRGAFAALVHDAVQHGDTARVLTLLDAIATAPAAPATDPTAEVLGAALHSRLALLAGDTADAIAQLTIATSRTSEPFVTFYPLTTMAPERRHLMRLAAAKGMNSVADRLGRSFYNSLSFGDLLYQAWDADIRAKRPARLPPLPQGGAP